MTAAPRRGRGTLRRVGTCLGLAAALVVGSIALAPGLVPPAGVPRQDASPATAAGAPPAAARGVTVEGNRLLRDGEPFLPRGFNLIGLLTPDWCDRPTGVAARDHFGPAELAAARAWHADTLRFQVSQRGLTDPAVPAADRRAYLQRVVAGVALARGAGFTVVVSMQDQFFGCGAVHPMPSRQTVDAWTVLAPALQGDPYVLFELFNEPRNEADPAGWAQWRDGGSAPDANRGDPAVGHQALVDHLRGLGSRNVLVADVARLGERTTGLPRLTDPLGRLAYGIHPYVYTAGPAWWERQYGAAAASVPLVATEWNHLAAGCGTAEQGLAADLLGYLARHRIGVLGHAFDVPGTTVADWTWRPTACGTPSGGSGLTLRTFFAGLAARDAAARPTTPD